MSNLSKNVGPLSTSYGKRKSLKGNSDLPGDIPENDDEAELQQIRRASGKFGHLASKRVSLGGITEFSTSELVAQYANCMRLSAENKINHKNAFSLPLIDCMNLLLKIKDEQMENFQVVGCTLDASAKIYASRVDRVHMDGMSFAKGLGGRSKDTPVSQKEGSDDEETSKNTKPGKKKRSKTTRNLCRDATKFNICVGNVVNDPSYVILHRQFSNCHPSFISFMPKLKLVGDDCIIDMDMNKPFLPERTEAAYGDKIVPFEFDVDGNEELVSSPYREILSKDCDNLQYDKVLNASQTDDSFGDIDVCQAEVENESDNDAFGYDMLEGYSVAKDASTWKGESQIELEAVRAAECAARAGPREKVVDIQEAILKQVKEGGNIAYLYANLDRMLCAGPAHWQLLPKYKVRDKDSALAKGRKQKKKQVDFMDFINSEDASFPSRRAVTLTRQYIENNWTTNKITTPLILHFEPNFYTRYFNRPQCGFNIGPLHNKSLPLEEEDLNDYDYNNLNDSQHYCPAANSPMAGSDGNCSGNKEVLNFVEESEAAADVHSFDPTSGDAWSMVDPPAKVARILVPYAHHAKRVNMKLLKSAIWRVLTEDSGCDEVDDSGVTPKKKSKNRKNVDVNSSQISAMKQEMKFSEMERRVMKIVPSEMSQELSMPIVFNALLHLANEQVLSLTELLDHSDILINQDRGAEHFVRKLQERQFI